MVTKNTRGTYPWFNADITRARKTSRAAEKEMERKDENK